MASQEGAVDNAMHEFTEDDREETNEAVRAALHRLDGSPESTVSLLTGVPVEELDQYGGMSKAG